MENRKRPKVSIAKIVQHANDIAVGCKLFMSVSAQRTYILSVF